MVIFYTIKILGAVAYGLVLTTLVSGLLRKRFQYTTWKKFHLSFAIAAVVFASTHISLILIFH